MPKYIAVDEYQTRTSVESGAGRPSTGWYCENPVSSAARCHAGSSSLPSMTISASMRGGAALVWPARAL